MRKVKKVRGWVFSYHGLLNPMIFNILIEIEKSFENERIQYVFSILDKIIEYNMIMTIVYFDFFLF